MQLVAPGTFILVESADADAAPHGELPYFVAGNKTVSGFTAIVEHFGGALDAALVSTEAATSMAWRAFIDERVGDLLAHALFAIGPNYYPLTRATLAAHLPIPQRYYIPGRFRELYRPRLEATALWDVGYAEAAGADRTRKAFAQMRLHDFEQAEDEVANAGEKIRTSFGRERVLERARDAFGPLVRVLGDRSFIYQDRPTSVDLLLAAHILLLVEPPYPERALARLVSEEFEPLTTHARLVLSLAFPTQLGPNHVPPEIVFAPPPSLLRLPHALVDTRPWLQFAVYVATGVGALALTATAVRALPEFSRTNGRQNAPTEERP